MQLLSLITKENPLNRDYVDPKQKQIEDSQASSDTQQELESGQESARTLTPGVYTEVKTQQLVSD